MDTYDEQRLREEVLYLHSLWHKGPPREQRAAQPHSNPSLHYISNRPQFKRENAQSNSKHKKGKSRAKNVKIQKENRPDYGEEWPTLPTPSTPPAGPSGWATFPSGPNSLALLLCPESQARFVANQAQIKALNRTREFLSKNDDDGIGDDDDDDDEHEEYMDEEDDDDGCEEYRFFYTLFKEDSGLKEYYVKSYDNGEFICLVCGGIGKKKAWKKFKDCVALIQHSLSIAKTMKMRAHRAYGQAICRILDWEIDKLPKITSELTEKRNEFLNRSRAGEGGVQENNAGETKDGSSILDSNGASLDNVSGVEVQEKVCIDDTTITSHNGATIEEVRDRESGSSLNVPNNGESVVLKEICTAVGDSERAEA